MPTWLKLLRLIKKKPSFTNIAIKTTITSIVLLAYSLNVNAAQAVLAWDDISEPSVSGYKLYYGSSRGNYNHSIDVGNQTSYTLTGLESEKTYYIAAKAYNQDKSKYSDFSNEITATLPSSTTSSEPNINEDTVPPIEVGEVIADHKWVRVNFKESFIDPVVIAPSMSYSGGDPSIVRIRNITSDGFDIRVQEWDYRDGWHTQEKIHFIAMEKGHYILPDGTKIEAGSTWTNTTSSFDTVNFQQPFNVSPVVLTSVTSDNEPDGVTARKKDISKEMFKLLLQEQEANSDGHAYESVDYIAAEPSVGMAGAIPFEIGRTEDNMDHKFRLVSFLNSYANNPIAILDLQTSDGMDTASLRWDNLTSNSVTVKVDEEQSMGDETYHTSEVVGYIIFGLANP
ncbi:fibronectin type III domain-containing protein [Nitrosococcus wardiae]|uniref:Fibronectin type III domain-containing protein n=1 Tax=Nitrosococcus wardiae TaxID=1814290 RepID=A0A4P7BYU5_9GAMM|nr:fibronectin type III domain-containing protein [Nitrosococcus wardiae]QBQ54429.1 fibronectin type III domain-containing protein [Nitrosococcus wardiae]